MSDLYNPEPIIDGLIATLDPEVSRIDPRGLRTYVNDTLLLQSERRPYTWSEFVAERPDLDHPRPFVYDRPSRLIFVGGGGVHALIAGQLFHFRSVKHHPAPDWSELSDVDWDVFRDLADKYIETGMGFMMGSVTAALGRRRITLGPSVRYSVAERKVFAMYEVERLTRPDQSERGDRQRG